MVILHSLLREGWRGKEKTMKGKIFQGRITMEKLFMCFFFSLEFLWSFHCQSLEGRDKAKEGRRKELSSEKFINYSMDVK